MAKALGQMIEEERSHLSWVKEWLDEQAAIRGAIVSELMARYAAIDDRIYDAVTAELGWRSAA